MRSGYDKVQEMTDRYVAKADQALSDKEKEIMEL
jgi:ribosome recycling factor